jgi:hypothetical protein
MTDFQWHNARALQMFSVWISGEGTFTGLSDSEKVKLLSHFEVMYYLMAE